MRLLQRFHLATNVPAGVLCGEVECPAKPNALVVFVYARGSVNALSDELARALAESGIASYRLDLLTTQEKFADLYTAKLRFHVELLASRLDMVRKRLARDPLLRDLPIGYYSGSTGTAPAIVGCLNDPQVRAIVASPAKIDFPVDSLGLMSSAVMLVIGGQEVKLIEQSEIVYRHLHCAKRLEIIEGASQLMQEGNAKKRLAKAATDWFDQHLKGGGNIAGGH